MSPAQSPDTWAPACRTRLEGHAQPAQPPFAVAPGASLWGVGGSQPVRAPALWSDPPQVMGGRAGLCVVRGRAGRRQS